MADPHSNAFVRLAVGLLLSCCAFAACAQTRAWLDRDHIALGETTTLNIQTDQATADAPDYSPLLADFILSGNTSSREYQVVNGVGSAHVLFAVALRPRRDGVIAVPALRIGNQQTPALTLTVAPQSSAPTHDGAVFIETQVDAPSPYVQQAVGYTVRLYSQTPLVSGQLDQDPPAGGSLQRIGDDSQYERDIGNRSYHVIERHYLLIPERSGPMTIPGAHFQGNAAGGFFDDFLGDGSGDIDVASPSRAIQVRPVPADAPQPWLPLRGLQLRYLSTPQRARVGEAATVTIEAVADGATAAQLPELQLQADDGAQVFADPVQSDDRFDDGRPHVREARKFSIVPARAGTLRLQGPRVSWWDVQAGVRRTASLPDLVLRVVPGAGGAGTTSGAAPTTTSDAESTEENRSTSMAPNGTRPWALATVAFAALWLGTLAWALQRRSNVRPGHEVEATSLPLAPDRPASSVDLKRALERGALGEVADVLCAMAGPAADLDAVRDRLADPCQRDAVDALQRARWGDGDGVAARTALRQAFKGGPRWRAHGQAITKEPLPPLYPRH
jgi:hypothetical protein